MFLKLTFLFLFCFEIAGADVCYVKSGHLLNVTCHTNHTDINSLVWKVGKSNYSVFSDLSVYSDPSGYSLTLFKCTPSGCSSLNSDLPISATVTLDSTNNSIVSSNLIGSLVNVTIYNLSHYSNLVCETVKERYNICEAIQIYADPENVTCTPDDMFYRQIVIKCSVYPSGRLVDVRYNNITFSPTTDNDIISSWCTTTAPDNSQLYYTTQCYIYIDFTRLRSGDNYINVTVSPFVADTNVTITSNTIIIHLYDDLQEPQCGSDGFSGDYLYYMCEAPLFDKDVDCILKFTTNGTRTTNIYADRSHLALDSNNKVANRFYFKVMTRDLGPGQHEVQGIISNKNDKGEIIIVSSNWSLPFNIYQATEMNFTVNGSQNGVVAKVGDEIILNCNVNGFPPSQIILEDGMWRKEFNSYHLNTETVYIMAIKGCGDSDVYTCSSVGVLGETLAKKIYVNIPCQLKLRYSRDSESNFFSLGTLIDPISVKIEVFGYPAPRTMRLSNLPKSLTTSVHVVYTQEQGPYGTIEVQFNNTKLIADQFLQLDVDNGVGNTSFNFYIEVTNEMSIYGSTTSICLTLLNIMSTFFI